MKYTVRYAHLEEIPQLKPGTIVHRGDTIGRMGNTGKSTGAHLHIDLRKGSYAYSYRMKDILYDFKTHRQLIWFIDKELFNSPFQITTYYCDPEYTDSHGNWVYHPAYDVVPKNRHKTNENYIIYWNRSKPGKVLLIGSDPGGYGNYIYIEYDTGG